MIDRFTTQEFEDALPRNNGTGERLWTDLGMIDGEKVYAVHAGAFSRVMIRSSIDESGQAADSGEDSIRLWLEIMTSAGGFKPVKKMDTYTTRVPGWDRRMTDKVRELYKAGIKIRRTLPDGLGFWFVKSGKNEGRPAAKNFKTKNQFTWMDELEAPEDESWVPSQRSLEAQIPDGNDEFQPEAPKSEPDMFSELNALANQEFEKAEPVTPEAEKVPSAQQMAAIVADIDRPTRVIAAAGSGKTFILAERIKHLLAHGAEPHQIVVVTFTKDMSKDMAERIIRVNPEIAGTQGEAQICSIHAFCNRIMTAEGIGLRIPDKSWEIKRMLQDIAKELWPYSNEADPSTCRPTWEELANVFGNAKHRAMKFGQDYEWYESMWGGYQAERLVRAREMFDQKMRANKWWTFADMLYEMEIRLMDDEDFRHRCQDRFQYIMIDEGQDTNGQAMRILTTIAQPRNQIFIVGDPDQLLFRFTGATPEMNLYDGFTDRYPDGQMFFLETNYRSTHRIVDSSNLLIANNYEGAGGPYEDMFQKTCNARDGAEEGQPIYWDLHGSAQEEAESVAISILDKIARGMEPGDIFVGSRTRAQLGYLEPPLTKLGIPFINITGGSFWMLRHVKHILSYLRLAMDGSDAESFRAIYNIASNSMQDRYGEYCPTRWLGNSFLREMDRTYDGNRAREATWKYSGWQAGIRDLVWMMNQLEDMVRGLNEDVKTPKDMCRWIIDNSVAKYLKYEEGIKDENDIGKMADLETVCDVAGQFESLETFFERIDEAIQAAKDAKSKNWEKYVVLSTVHRLKGMERKVMYGIGWCEGEREIGDAGVMPVGLLPHTFSLTEPPAKGVLHMGGQSRVEDERCIGYVLITRAQEEVFLSGFAEHRGAEMWASRFISELGLL